jgi:RNase P/RNase MRP subunit p30
MIAIFLGKKDKKILDFAEKKGLEILFIKPVSILNDLDKKESNLYDGVLIKNYYLEQVRRIIEKGATIFSNIFVLGVDDEINRVVLENKKTTGLISPEFERIKDYMDHRNSGLNQVLCAIASKNKKMIIENLNDFFKLEKKNKALLLGKWTQNIKLCKKYRTNLVLIPVANNMDEILSLENLKNIYKDLGLTVNGKN